MQRIALAFVFVLSFSLVGFRYTSNSEHPSVADEAGLLSAETHALIEALNLQFEPVGAEIVVVVIRSLDNLPIENYASCLFRLWRIGDVEKNNGILLLIALEDQEVRIEIGHGLAGFLPDGFTGRILCQTLFPAFKQERYDEGVRDAVRIFASRLSEVYDIELTVEGFKPVEDPGGVKRLNELKDSPGRDDNRRLNRLNFLWLIFLFIFGDWF